MADTSEAEVPQAEPREDFPQSDVPTWFKTPHTDVRAIFMGAEGFHNNYRLENSATGKTKDISSPYAEDVFRRHMDTSSNGTFGTTQGIELAQRLSEDFLSLGNQDQRGTYNRVLKPGLRGLIPAAPGIFGDTASLFSYMPGPRELIEKAVEAYTGDTPENLSRQRALEKIAREGYAKIDSNAMREMIELAAPEYDKWTQENWGFKIFKDYLGLDFTPAPREDSIAEKALAGAIDLGMLGAVQAKFAVSVAELGQGALRIFKGLLNKEVRDVGVPSAEKYQNLIDIAKKTDRSLIDKAGEAYSLRNPKQYAGEVAFGTASAASSEVALAGLDKVDPEASDFLRTAVALGTGFTGPLVMRSGLTGLLQLPGIRSIVTQGVVDPILRPYRSAARFVQRKGLGTGPLNQKGVLETSDILAEALRSGRGVDQASGLVFTTSELARSEANILREKARIARGELESMGPDADPKEVARLEEYIKVTDDQTSNLGRTATFYENVLRAGINDPDLNVASRFFEAQAKGLVDRREQFFNYIENTFKKNFEDLDFNGDKGGSNKEWDADYDEAINSGKIPKYEHTRRKLVMEGQPQGVAGSERSFLNPELEQSVNNLKADLGNNMRQTLESAREAADVRIEFWNKKIDRLLRKRGLKSVDELSSAEQIHVGSLLRGQYADVAREFRGFEKAVYGRVAGINTKSETDIVFPENSVGSNGEPIAGMTPSEWAASEIRSLTRAETANPARNAKEIAQIAGGNSILAVIKKQQRQGEAASGAEGRIIDLERQLNTSVAKRAELQKAVDEKLGQERIEVETKTRSLNDFIERAKQKVPVDDDSIVRAIDAFVGDPELNWSQVGVAEGRAPRGYQTVFNRIAQQKRAIARLGDGTTASPAIEALDKKIASLDESASKAQSKIDDITSRYLGDNEPLLSNGRLDGSTSAQDVTDVVSDIAAAMRSEPDKKGIRYRNLLQARKVIEQLVSTEVFPGLDSVSLGIAKEASIIKHRVLDAQAESMTRQGNNFVTEPEVLPNITLPAGASIRAGGSAVRKLWEATIELPDYVTIKKNADDVVQLDAEGTPIAVFNEDLFGTSDSSILDRPGSPFVRVSQGEIPGGLSQLQIRPGSDPSPRALKLAENVLLERMALQFTGGVDSKSLDSFRQQNRSVINFLESNERPIVPRLLSKADGLTEQVSALNNLLKDKAKTQLTELVNNGSISLNGSTIDDYVDYLGFRRKQYAENSLFAQVIKAEPGEAVRKLFDTVTDASNTQPRTQVKEFLSVLGDNKQAGDGFKSSVIAEIFRRSTTSKDSLQVTVGDLRAGAFDPVSFRETISDPRVRTIIQEVFPDNPALLDGLDKLGEVAFEPGLMTRSGGGVETKLDIRDSLNMEAWGNLGRILGLQAAERVGFINSLVAAGAGARYLRGVGKNITGNVIKDIVIEAALSPQKAVDLGKTTLDLGTGLVDSFAKFLVDVPNLPKAVYRGVTNRPGSALRFIEETLDEDEGDVGPQASLQQVSPPAYRSASAVPLRQPISASGLSNASPVSPSPTQVSMAPPPRPTAQGTSSQEVIDLGRKLFGANDTVFANQGGYIGRPMEHSGIMSVRNKPRQLVG